MDLVQAIVFVCVAILSGLAALLALVRVGFLALDSKDGRRRDGPAIGTRLRMQPLTDVKSRRVTIPDSERWQVLIFADHSLLGFPGLIADLEELARDPFCHVVVVSKTAAGVQPELLHVLPTEVGLVSVSDDYYARHGVRTMPLAVVVAPSGSVAAKSLVGARGAVIHLWREHVVEPKCVAVAG